MLKNDRWINEQAAAGMLEPFGVPGAATINAIGFSLWALWALLLGVALLMRRNGAVVATPQMA